jgi:CheY-like chemotaxis protein
MIYQERLRVLIVDDSSHFRSGARALLETFSRVGTVATVASGEEALTLLKREHFDLMVLDLAMDGMGGLEVARRLRGNPAAPKILMVSLYDEPEFRRAADNAGVDLFMNKPALAGQLEPVLDRLFGATA